MYMPGNKLLYKDIEVEHGDVVNCAVIRDGVVKGILKDSEGRMQVAGICKVEVAEPVDIGDTLIADDQGRGVKGKKDSVLTIGRCIERRVSGELAKVILVVSKSRKKGATT